MGRAVRVGRHAAVDVLEHAPDVALRVRALVDAVAVAVAALVRVRGAVGVVAPVAAHEPGAGSGVDIELEPRQRGVAPEQVDVRRLAGVGQLDRHRDVRAVDEGLEVPRRRAVVGVQRSGQQEQRDGAERGADHGPPKVVGRGESHPARPALRATPDGCGQPPESGPDGPPKHGSNHARVPRGPTGASSSSRSGRGSPDGRSARRRLRRRSGGRSPTPSPAASSPRRPA